MMTNIGITPNGYLFDFLTFKVDPEIHPVLLWAQQPGILSDGTINALAVLSRSYILLRLASARVEDLLNYTGVNKNELMFWWNSLGLDLGYWTPGNAPQDMIDLWADIEPNIVDIEHWFGGNPTPQLAVFRRDLPFELKQMVQFNRVGLWGIGL
jgi:hypothetical protein